MLLSGFVFYVISACIYSIAHLSVQSACYHCRDSFPWVEYCEEWLMVSKVVAMQLLIKILLFLSENSSFHCLTMSWKHTLWVSQFHLNTYNI